jgi:hypothetical protein
MEHVLSCTDSEQLALYIALGEQKGGEWNFDLMEWAEPPPPAPVFAIPAEMKGQQ